MNRQSRSNLASLELRKKGYDRTLPLTDPERGIAEHAGTIYYMRDGKISGRTEGTELRKP